MEVRAMSESLFLNQHIQSFASLHQPDAGWKVYEFPGATAHRISLPYLLDFLQDCHPEAVKHRTTLKELVEADLIGTVGAAYSAEPGTEWDLSRELESEGWYGVVEIEWAGHPMHFVSFLIKARDGYTAVYQVATKSNVALRKFTHALDAYGKSRQKEDARHILVVNGDNIPLTPVSWDDIFLPLGFIENIRSNVTMFFEGGERYRELGIPYRRGLLFAGPPGCGKTLTLKALAYHTAAKFITVLGKSGVDDSDIQRALDVAGNCSPAVVLFEDLDKLIEAKDVSLSHFLNLLDGLKVLSGVLVIATCNEPEKLDPALLHRPSRFDRIWKFPLPAIEQRLALLRKQGGTYFSEPVLRDVAQRSHGFSMTYVQEIVVNALLECAHDGKNPSDEDLFRSFDTIRLQRRSASKGADSLEAQENVGFALSNHAGFSSDLSKLT
jgi:hypothetical protein